MADVADVRSSQIRTRKRPRISYCELSSDEEDGYSTGDSVVPVKKQKTATSIRKRPPPKRKIFPFLSLPAELRNQIYTYTLTDPDGIYLVSAIKAMRRVVKREPLPQHKARSSGSDESKEEPGLISLVPNLLAVNRQINKESVSVLYRNTIILRDTTDMHVFLASIGPHNMLLLRDIVVRHWGYSRTDKARNYPALSLLGGALNLQRLRFDCAVGWSYGNERHNARRLAQRIYRDGFHWLEKYGAARGKRDAAVQLLEFRDDNFIAPSWNKSSQEKKDVDFGPQIHLFQEELSKLLQRPFS